MCVCVYVCVCVRVHVCVCMCVRDFTESLPEIKKGVTELLCPQIYTRTHWEPWSSPLPATSLQSPRHHDRISCCKTPFSLSATLLLPSSELSPDPLALLTLTGKLLLSALGWKAAPLSTSTPSPVACLWVQGLLSLEGCYFCKAPSLLFFAE